MAKDKHHGYERIANILEGGRKFTEEVIRENERLREENYRLGTTVSDEQVTQLEILNRALERLALLEQENTHLTQGLAELRRQRRAMERENFDYAARYEQITKQNASLLNLYVATHQLRSTLEFSTVLRMVREIVVNLLGSEHFDIVLYDALDERTLYLTSANSGDAPSPQRLSEQVVLETIRTGNLHASTGEDGRAGQACVPLKLDGSMLGALVVHSFLPHKPALEDIDFELIELLSEDVVGVMFAAYAYSSTNSFSSIAARSGLVRKIAEQAQREERSSSNSVGVGVSLSLE